MDGLINEVIEACKGRIVEVDMSRGANGEYYIDLAERDLETVMYLLSENGFELSCMYCAEGFEKNMGCTLFYAFEKKGYENLAVFRLPLRWNRTTSIADRFPSASWYQREITDGFGIEFAGAFDDRRLFLHEPYGDGFHPLQKSFKNQEIKVKEKIDSSEEYNFRKVHGEGVYEIPVGPVHAGIIEPGHFRFSVIGETIYHIEIRMFYKHRGIEKLAEGKTPEECVKIAESISGDETVANATALCNAVEKISQIHVPDRAWYLRTIFLEMERIYSLLGDLAGMCIDIAFPVGASPFFILREEILRRNKELTGSRFMKDIICVGGLKRDAPEDALKNLGSFLDEFAETFKDATEYIHSNPSVIDRFERTGIIKKELISPLHLTGPMARASSAAIDTRIDHAYAIYDRITPKVKTRDSGDVLARFEVKSAEILDSVNMTKRIIEEMPEGKVATEYKILDGYAASLVEAPRGQSFHWVYIRNGLIDRYKIRTASFCNWQGIEHAVIGNIVPDFPLINKSLNLSYAGTDL